MVCLIEKEKNLLILLEIGNSLNEQTNSIDLNTECAFYEFKCDDGKCIDRNKLCDAVNDCNDGEDENESTAECNFNISQGTEATPLQ